MATATELIKLKERITQAQATASRLQGRRDALLEELKTFGVKSPEAARKLLAEKEREVSAVAKELDEAVEAFRIKYKV